MRRPFLMLPPRRSGIYLDSSDGARLMRICHKNTPKWRTTRKILKFSAGFPAPRAHFYAKLARSPPDTLSTYLPQDTKLYIRRWQDDIRHIGYCEIIRRNYTQIAYQLWWIVVLDLALIFFVCLCGNAFLSECGHQSIINEMLFFREFARMVPLIKNWVSI